MSGRTTKRCSSSLHIGERELPLSEFHKATNSKDGLSSKCRACNRRDCRTYYEANRERISEEAKLAARHRSPSRKKYMKKWQAENPDKLRGYTKKWNDNNKSKLRANFLVYRARKVSAGGNATAEKIAARWDYFNGKCWMCGEEATAMDHIKPVIRGGGTFASNMRPACKSCNSSKGHKWPFPTSVLSSPWSSD